MFKRLLTGLVTPTEAVLVLICLALLMGIFEKEDLEMETRKAMQACERDRENAALYAKALSNVLNGGGLVLGSTSVSCRARHS